MNAQPKRRAVRAGQPEPELSKLKELWRTLSDDARAFWRARVQSSGAGNTQPEIRRDILAKLKINLRHDNQLTNFKNFVEDQDKREEEAELMFEDERNFRDQFPGISEEELRKKVLAAYYSRALARGETGLGKAMMRQDLQERRFQFEQEQFLESKKTAQEKALELCLEETKALPEVAELFKAAFAALKKAKAKK